MTSYSEACCNVPPALGNGYKRQGSMADIAGMKTYITGPESAKKAILVIHDIFGFKDQTIQGADLLSSLDTELTYRVFMPDFFNGEPADTAWYPPDTDEKKANFFNFIQTMADPVKKSTLVPNFIKQADQTSLKGAFESWAIVGFCWGGRMAAILAGEGSLFKAAVSCHPGMLKNEDAARVTIPFAILASKDEPAEEVASFAAHLKVPKYIETFRTQIHGWMSARGNLGNPEVLREYERGYRTAVKFLAEHVAA